MNNENYNTILSEIIISNPKGYHTLLKKNPNYKYLLNYIIENTPLLNDKRYKFVTRVYWIINHITTFDDPLLRCKECGKIISDNPRFGLNGYGDFCSLSCCNKNEWHHNNCKETSIKHFGEGNYMNRRKAEETNLEKFGSKHFMGTDKFFEMGEQTMQEKYGISNPMESEIFIKKIKESKFKNHGNENFVNSEKAKETNLEKYGVESYAQTEEYKEKVKETNLERYGTIWTWQSENNKQKSKKTCLERYGSEYFTSSIYFKNSKHRYFYDNIFFDSKPELCYYIWLKDNNIDFEYSPNVTFTFLDNDGVKHSYHPDFRVENRYVEIKGSHFFNTDGTMRNPWKNRNWTEEQKKKSDEIYEAKHQCMLENHIEILSSDDYKKYNTYVEKKYGKQFLRQFSVKNED